MSRAVGLLIAPLAAWVLPVNQTVPQPYLDEVFHVPQGQQYCAGNFFHWDPKITTPPGLYLISYIFKKSLGTETFDLRKLNAICLMLLAVCVDSIYTERLKVPDLPVKDDATIKRRRWLAEHNALNIALFPPLFFFSALYYTDMASTLSVVVFHYFFLRSHRHHAPAWYRLCMLVVLGGCSLLFRQTNIFWVAIFPAAIVLVDHIDHGHAVIKDSMYRGTEGFGDSLISVAKSSWKHETLYDPPVGDAWMSDYVKTIISIASCTAKVATRPGLLVELVVALSPFIAIIAAFVGFITWNGSIVLGDKSNHVATLHLPQMLYIWPYFIFFSWPLVYQYLLLYPFALIASLPPISHLEQLLVFRRRVFIPRWWVGGAFILGAAAVVRFNTIIHPFTLADNRHYTFYVFRLLTRAPWVRYAVVPLYFLGSWACIQATGAKPSLTPDRRSGWQFKLDGQIPQPSTKDAPKDQHKKGSRALPLPDAKYPASISFLLAWLATTSLQLVTAPLVEPRYLILPWIFWRMHLPIRQPEIPAKVKETLSGQGSGGATTSILQQLKITYWDEDDHRLWLETVWFLVVNVVTGYIFLNWGFSWPQEPGVIQRFMW